MSTGRGSRKGRRAYWREADARRELDSLSASGLSLSEYCRRTGVPEGKLRRWQRRLASASSPAVTPGFREVRVRETPAAIDTDSVVAGEVVVGRFVVRAPLGFDEDELSRLIATVSSC